MYRVGAWIGCTPAASDNTMCLVIMDSDKTVEVIFDGVICTFPDVLHLFEMEIRNNPPEKNDVCTQSDSATKKDFSG